MHEDLAALEIVCRHYRTEYGEAALREARKKVRQLRAQLMKLTLEVGFLRLLLKVWVNHVRSLA